MHAVLWVFGECIFLYGLIFSSSTPPPPPPPHFMECCLYRYCTLRLTSFCSTFAVLLWSTLSPVHEVHCSFQLFIHCELSFRSPWLSVLSFFFFFFFFLLYALVLEFLFLFFFFLASSDVVRVSGRPKDRLPVRLSLATKGSESQEGVTDSRASERLATPSTGGRLSFKGSGLPVLVRDSLEGSKVRRVAAEGRLQKQKP